MATNYLVQEGYNYSNLGPNSSQILVSSCNDTYKICTMMYNIYFSTQNEQIRKITLSYYREVDKHTL